MALTGNRLATGVISRFVSGQYKEKSIVESGMLASCGGFLYQSMDGCFVVNIATTIAGAPMMYIPPSSLYERRARVCLIVQTNK